MSNLVYVLTPTTAVKHDDWQVAYVDHAGERKTIDWLTGVDALRRAKALKLRGYRVETKEMRHVAPLFESLPAYPFI